MKVKSSVDAKVRPVSNVSLEKGSLLGAARLYISKDTLISLTGNLETGQACVVERLDSSQDADTTSPVRREASLWVLPDKNVSPNVVMMTRAFQEATGFKLGDQVRISVKEAVPDADQVVVRDISEPSDEDNNLRMQHALSWEASLSLYLDRAEQVFPEMKLDGVSIGRLRKSFKVVSVNAQSHNLANYKLATTTIRIASSDEDSSNQVAPSNPGDLTIRNVPGLSSQVKTLNSFLKGFTRPFYVPNELESCGMVIHGGHGTGKTFLLQKIADTNWGKVHWVKPSDKLTTIREVFKQAIAQQPSLIFFDAFEELISKERSNRESVIECIGEELDSLSSRAQTANALPQLAVIATCSDYVLDVPAKLQKRSRFMENIVLPIPRAPERLEILSYLDPPLHPGDKDSILSEVASKTHAYNGEDLAKLVLKAKRILGARLDELSEIAAPDDTSKPQHDPDTQPGQPGETHYLAKQDIDEALRVTRPSAMHDINLKPPTIHWQDVGGQDALKKVLTRMVKSAKQTRPLSRKVFRHSPKGLLLYGPPGCSKTLLAQAMATESSFNFFAVKGAELLNMYVGESERAVRTLFERARAAAPSIIFFDEIDSIGGQRSGNGAGGGGGGGSSAGKASGSVNMLTTLLTEMDGFEALTGVLVLAATNRPEAMDPALLRPGRFDQNLYVGPPNQRERESVFKVHLRDLSVAEDVDIAALAASAEGYSGAEISAICHEAGWAVWERYEEDAEEGKEGVKLEITMADLTSALGKTPRGITREMIDGYDRWSRQFKKTL